MNCKMCNKTNIKTMFCDACSKVGYELKALKALELELTNRGILFRYFNDLGEFGGCSSVLIDTINEYIEETYDVSCMDIPYVAISDAQLYQALRYNDPLQFAVQVDCDRDNENAPKYEKAIHDAFLAVFNYELEEGSSYFDIEMPVEQLLEATLASASNTVTNDQALADQIQHAKKRSTMSDEEFAQVPRYYAAVECIFEDYFDIHFITGSNQEHVERKLAESDGVVILQPFFSPVDPRPEMCERLDTIIDAAIKRESKKGNEIERRRFPVSYFKLDMVNYRLNRYIAYKDVLKLVMGLKAKA